MPRAWWLRDILFLAIVIAAVMGAWWGLAYAGYYVRSMQYVFRIIVLIGINITLAVSLNIINGHAGQFSLGHAGFMAIGGYSSAYLTFYHFGPWVHSLSEAQRPLMQNVLLVVALLVGAAVSALAGYLVGLPSLRLRGDYLAIVTLGFGEIIRVIILNVDAVGGSRGFSGIPPWANFFWVFFFAVLTVIISRRLIHSSLGRAFTAVREDEIAAESVGVDTTRYKVLAFIIGSALAGVAGGLYAHYTPAYLNPDTFTFIRSFEIVVMIVLGGLGSISGAVVGAVVLTVLPQLLRFLNPYIPGGRDPRMVIYSVLLIALMLTRPQGLFGRGEIWNVLPRRKDRIPRDARDRGDAGDPLDPDDGPPVT
jgi:branched-chain amino acid transport system permease protein